MPSDPVVDVVMWIGLCLLTLTLFLFVGIFFMRIGLLRRQKHQRKVLSAWARIFKGCLENDIPELPPPLEAGDVNTFTSLWLNYQELADPSAQEILNLIAVRAGLDKHVLTIAQKSSVRERIMAITVLGFLQDRSTWDVLLRFVHEENPSIAMAAAKALVRTDAEAAVPIVLDIAARRNDWPAPRVMIFLQEAGIDRVSRYLGPALANASPEKITRLAPYLEITRTDVALPILERTMRSLYADAPALIACLRAATRFGRFPNLDPIQTLTHHPDWEVRVAAIQALGKLGGAGARKQLVALLHDPQEMVRHTAAKTITGHFSFDMKTFQTDYAEVMDAPTAELVTRAAAEWEAGQ